ncbi:MAG: hypothetical protein ABW360_10525 [Phenylobacterium sp.]
MPPEPANLDPQKLWQGQTPESDPMTLAALHEQARTFRRRIGRRNAVEYIAGVVVILGFLPVLFHRESWMMQAGGALVIAATVFVTWQLHRRASAGAVPEVGAPLTDFYRSELIRQRDALRSVGVWYIAPFMPGMALILLGRWFQSHAAGRSVAADHAIIAGAGLVAVAVFAGVWLLNRRGARKLQQRIDEL